jgi:hypothetical protein
MTLIELQRDMRVWLTREDAGVAHRFGPDAAPGLSVYLNTYRAQLIACLEDSFEQTRAWIGDEEFGRAATIHIDRVPPSSWTLDAYGRDFAATLGTLFPDDPEVAELAWIDFALGEAFVGLDVPALTASDVAGVDWDRAALHVTPTLDLGDLTTNAAAIWSALMAQEVPPAATPLPERGAVLVWRQGQVSHFRAIDQHEQQALLSIRAGMSFPQLCGAMVDAFGEEEGIARAGAMLGQWLADGLIVGVDEGRAGL